jgi:ferredoxin
LDSCQLLEYAAVALDQNFRKDRKDRIRHWMMCKFGAAAGGMYSGCVGCGRCIRMCPSKIDITEVAKVLRNSDKK